MSLLIVYLVLMIIGDFVAYLNVEIERTFPSASCRHFSRCNFLFLWVAWIIAVRITEPKKSCGGIGLSRDFASKALVRSEGSGDATNLMRMLAVRARGGRG